MPSYRYNSDKYKTWRSKVFRRDLYQCQLCGERGELNAHHIRRKADNKSLVYKTENGITLCVQCHEVVTGREKIFEKLFETIVLGKLTLEFVYNYFSGLVKEYPSIISELKQSQKWLLIPEWLVKKVKKTKKKHVRTSRSV